MPARDDAGDRHGEPNHVRFRFCFFLTALATVGAACRNNSDTPAPPVALESRQAIALRTAANNQPVRWISPRVLCAIPFESSNVVGCEALLARTLPGETYRELRAAVAADSTDAPAMSCAIVSKEIHFADSTLVVVYLTGPTVEDKFAGLRGTWVWFRRVANHDSVWTTAPANDIISDVAPVRSQADCQ